MDRRILQRIVEVLEPRAGETVVEIGPGRGAMTEILAPRAERVVAIEYDRALAAMLSERFRGTNVTVIQADVLETDLSAAAGGEYALIGNVPYYITTPIIFHALRRPRASRAVFLVQSEVADRMGAAPGSKSYGALSVNLQVLAMVEPLFQVPAGAFQPPPKVSSKVVRVTPLAEPLVEPAEEGRFRDFVQRAFGLRRKQMRRVLRQILSVGQETSERMLDSAGVAPDARPENLTTEQFVRLARHAR